MIRNRSERAEAQQSNQGPQLVATQAKPVQSRIGIRYRLQIRCCESSRNYAVPRVGSPWIALPSGSLPAPADITEGLHTDGAMGKAMLTIMAAFAQLERDTMSERTRAGRAAANGRKADAPARS